MSNSRTTKSRRSQFVAPLTNPTTMIHKKQQAFYQAQEALGHCIVEQLKGLKAQMSKLRDQKKQIQTQQKEAKEQRILAAKRCAQHETKSTLKELEKAKKAYLDSQHALEKLEGVLQEQKLVLKTVQAEYTKTNELKKIIKHFDKKWSIEQKKKSMEK